MTALHTISSMPVIYVIPSRISGSCLRQCDKHTKPGGWVEFQDWDALAYSEDGSMKGTALEKYYNACIPAFEKAGYPTRPGPYLEEWFREACFEFLSAFNEVLGTRFVTKGTHSKAYFSWAFPEGCPEHDQLCEEVYKRLTNHWVPWYKGYVPENVPLTAQSDPTRSLGLSMKTLEAGSKKSSRNGQPGMQPTFFDAAVHPPSSPLFFFFFFTGLKLETNRVGVWSGHWVLF